MLKQNRNVLGIRTENSFKRKHQIGCWAVYFFGKNVSKKTRIQTKSTSDKSNFGRGEIHSWNGIEKENSESADSHKNKRDKGIWNPRKSKRNRLLNETRAFNIRHLRIYYQYSSFEVHGLLLVLKASTNDFAHESGIHKAIRWGNCYRFLRCFLCKRKCCSEHCFLQFSE